MVGESNRVILLYGGAMFGCFGMVLLFWLTAWIRAGYDRWVARWERRRRARGHVGATRPRAAKVKRGNEREVSMSAWEAFFVGLSTGMWLMIAIFALAARRRD